MLAFFALFSPHPPVDTAVRATLSDGQVLMGEVRTRVLRLTGGSGVLDVPLADVGEVVPAGDQLQAAEGLVDVWLRNGSQLRGRWTDPALAMGIAVGGREVPVDLPMNELSRFQLQGGEAWPQGPVYRLRTTFGDDFLVDPSRTQLVVENQLGTFSPSLSECVRVAPVDAPDGDWRLELATGTVLIGHLHDAALTVALPMGPEQVTVALANFVSLNVESWNYPQPEAPVRLDDGAPRAAPGLPVSQVQRTERKAQQAAAWFDNDALESAKAASAEE